jgi:hypothetical protein
VEEEAAETIEELNPIPRLVGIATDVLVTLHQQCEGNHQGCNRQEGDGNRPPLDRWIAPVLSGDLKEQEGKKDWQEEDIRGMDEKPEGDNGHERDGSATEGQPESKSPDQWRLAEFATRP